MPVVTINKKRQSDTSPVEVEIIGSANRVITSSQMSVSFYQAQAAVRTKSSHASCGQVSMRRVVC